MQPSHRNPIILPTITLKPKYTPNRHITNLSNTQPSRYTTLSYTQPSYHNPIIPLYCNTSIHPNITSQTLPCAQSSHNNRITHLNFTPQPYHTPNYHTTILSYTQSSHNNRITYPNFTPQPYMDPPRIFYPKAEMRLFCHILRPTVRERI
jgi:hypothetical protein